MKKSITILTGPQGSGNHLFSKVFSLHGKISGWPANLTSETWVGHDMEPYNTIWNSPDGIESINWSGDYHVISVSCPYVFEEMLYKPNYKRIVDALEARGFHVQFAIIGRDQNILRHQQCRVRDGATVDYFLDDLPYLISQNHFFVSQELLYLYGKEYVMSIGDLLNIPVVTDERLDLVLSDDANQKYIKYADHTEQDNEVWKASGMDKYIDIIDNDGC